jgi:hypothetical protein
MIKLDLVESNFRTLAIPRLRRHNREGSDPRRGHGPRWPYHSVCEESLKAGDTDIAQLQLRGWVG